MSSSLEQIKEATKRKSNGFFFIKSKHVHPTYKNHTYFEMKQKYYTEQSQNPSYRKFEDPSPQSVKMRRWKMFVEEPSSYGLENTYRYMCDRIRFVSHNKNTSLKTLQTENPGGEKETLQPKLETVVSEQLTQPQRILPLPDKKYTHKHSRPQMVNKYLQTTQSFNYRIRKSKNLGEEMKMHEIKAKQKSINFHSAEHMLQMIYISGKVRDSADIDNRICLNLLPYVINCFFKCKINYQKKITQSEYDHIKNFIEEVKSIPKNYFDVKDIINLSTVGEVLEILQIYGFGTLQWIQTVRYFFMPTEDILAYQFEKLLDEVKVMSIMKFNAEISHQPIYIYRVQDKVKINHVYDMLKPGTYIYSQNKACYEIYCSILKSKAEAFSYKNRIKKWRSVAPLDQTETISPERIQNEDVPLQKYERLFQLRKERRKKYSIKKQTLNSGILITAQSSFIDKSKLHHSEDIFQ